MLKRIWKISMLFLKRWLSDGKTVFGLFLLAFFSYLTYSPLNEFVSFVGVKASPWIFSFFASQSTLLLVIAGSTHLIFSDAFLVDAFAQQIMIRSNRRIYIYGQIIFISIAALFVSIIMFLFSILATLFSIAWEPGWGRVIHTIADQPQLIMDRTGLELYFSISSVYINTVPAIPSTLFSLLLMWLYMTFTAAMIGCFRVLTGRMIGLIISGLLTFLSMFAISLGLLSYGNILRFISPLLWCTPINLNWYGVSGIPTIGYAVMVYGTSILIMAAVSVVRFQWGDIQEQLEDKTG